jgi:uncharacterized protein YdaU (DUF1376 family)
MNNETNTPRIGMAYAVAIIGAFLIVAALVYAMRRYAQPPAPNAARAAERAAALSELRAAEADAQQNMIWINRDKGIVRLRIEDAMKVVEQQWKNPSAARSNLIARGEQATAVPPPQPSEFE